MDIVGRNNGCHCHVVPPFVILDDIALILLERMVCVKKKMLPLLTSCFSILTSAGDLSPQISLFHQKHKP